MKYENQYLNLPKEQKLRTTFEIDLNDVAILRSYDPKAGTLQTTASILFKKLIHELKQSKLEPGDFSTFAAVIGDCTITLGGNLGQRGTATVPSTGMFDSVPVKAARRNVGRGIAKLARKTT
jgi:hypothetical protein